MLIPGVLTLPVADVSTEEATGTKPLHFPMYDDDDDHDSSVSCDSDCSSDWDDDDESLMEIEERIQEFSRVGSTPALAELVSNAEEFNLPRVTRAKQGLEEFSKSFHGTPVESKSFKMRKSASKQGSEQFSKSCHETPFETKSFKMRKSASDVCFQSLEYSSTTNESSKNDDEVGMKPDDCLESLLRQQGMSVTIHPANSLQGFFIEMRADNFAAYDKAIAIAVRVGDLNTVKEHKKAGKTLQCCNKFQESIIHTICRRGRTQLLRYILEDTDTFMNICDEQGRTPLHDAAWTDEPNFELVKLVIQRCPDLLYIADNRGFTPLAYVGKQRWSDWCEFLEANRELLAPRELL
jgi:hypothetical protein